MYSKLILRRDEMKKFKFPIPAEATLVFEFAEENNIKEPTARYHLEKMVKAGVLTKSIELFEEEAAYYNPMHTHNWVNRAVYTPA
jgi:hypothetical protein